MSTCGTGEASCVWHCSMGKKQGERKAKAWAWGWLNGKVQERVVLLMSDLCSL